VKRREFITLLGGAAAWPLAVGAQQGEPVRRVGVLMNSPADDTQGQGRFAAFLQGLLSDSARSSPSAPSHATWRSSGIRPAVGLRSRA
jgi:hypothetical protein